MNFETCIPKNSPIILYLTASVKLVEKKEMKKNKDEEYFGIKMHAAALYSDYVDEV